MREDKEGEEGGKDSVCACVHTRVRRIIFMHLTELVEKCASAMSFASFCTVSVLEESSDSSLKTSSFS